MPIHRRPLGCPLCLQRPHDVSGCPDNGGEASRCENCKVTHSLAMKCRLLTNRTQQKRSGTVNWIEKGRETNYSRTVPVEITHPRAERPMRGFAIIDDQSSLTILDPSAVELMGLPSDIMATGNLSTTTVQGTSAPERCITVSGLQVASVKQVGDKIELPSAYLQKSFEDLHPDVPTKSQVMEMPGMEHLAGEFLQECADLKTVLLIGRNCIAAQRQNQFTSSRNRHQIASETPLGWCIMGRSPHRSTQNTGERLRESCTRGQTVPQYQ